MFNFIKKIFGIKKEEHQRNLENTVSQHQQPTFEEHTVNQSQKSTHNYNIKCKKCLKLITVYDTTFTCPLCGMAGSVFRGRNEYESRRPSKKQNIQRINTFPQPINNASHDDCLKKSWENHKFHQNHAILSGNDTLVTGYTWSSVYDTSTCLLCGVLNGVFFETIEEAQQVQAQHYCTGRHGCRCLLQPKLKTWRELGVDMDNLPETTQGKYTTFEAYWHDLPIDLQNEIAGRTRGELLRNGKIQWDDLLDVKKYKLRTLRELGFDMDEPTEEDFLPDEEAQLKRFKKLSITEQNKIVGVTRATLLKNGELRWNEVFDPKTKRLHTLKKLGIKSIRTPKNTKHTMHKDTKKLRDTKLSRLCSELGIAFEQIIIPYDSNTKKWVCGNRRPKKVEQAAMLYLNKQGYKGTFYEIHPIEILMQAACLDYVAEMSKNLIAENYLARSFTVQLELYGLDYNKCRNLIYNTPRDTIYSNLNIILSDNSIKQWAPFLKREDIIFVYENMGKNLFKEICEHILQAPQDNRNGFPDIFAFKEGVLHFFEVKTTDNLLETQIYTYNNFIKPRKIPTTLLKIKKG